MFVSIHAPERGAISVGYRNFHCFLGFNPRPRARGDWQSMGDIMVLKVSIHAPERGAIEE